MATAGGRTSKFLKDKAQDAQKGASAAASVAGPLSTMDDPSAMNEEGAEVDEELVRCEPNARDAHPCNPPSHVRADVYSVMNLLLPNTVCSSARSSAVVSRRRHGRKGRLTRARGWIAG